MKMNALFYKRILLILLIAVGLFGISNTYTIHKFGGSGDTRNRVVGARLMKDGISPYYYHWRPGAPLRYAIELDIDTTHLRKASSVTSSPVFHRLLEPFCEYDEPVIDRGLFVFFYILLIIMALMVWFESKYLLLTLAFFIPFLFSDAWCFHILMGQIYFLFGFMFFLISFALIKKQYFFAGLMLALLFLLRLNSIVFIFPFFLLLRKYRFFFTGLIAGLVVYGMVLMASPFERRNWSDYFDALKDFSALHLYELAIKPGTVPWGPLPAETDVLLPPIIEGQNFAGMRLEKERTPETNVFHEVSNFFHIYKLIFRKAPSLNMLNGILMASFGFIATTLLFLKKKQWKGKLPLGPLLFSGLLFYQLSCFLSPVNTYPYQTPQWMTIIGLAIIFHKKIPKFLLLIFFIGLLQNSIYLPKMSGKHIITEILFITATFGILVFGRWGAEAEIKLQENNKYE